MIQSFIHRLKNAADKRPFVGLELQDSGIALVAQKVTGGMPSMLAADYASQSDDASLEGTLKQWVAQYKLQKARVNVVLHSDDYQILLVEPPDVPEEEIRSAIRWRLKDLIKIPPESAAIDVFPLPVDGTKANKKMYYVVACAAERIRFIVDSVAKSGMELNSIDISELAIRNVVQRLMCDDSSERGVAIARIRRGIGSVYIYKGGNLYLARSFSLSYNGGLMDDLPQDTIALEVQRSIDYYERQMGQAPPAVVYLCGDFVSEDKVGATLKASVSMPMQVLDPASVIWVDESFEDEHLHFGVAALGAALRGMDG